MTAAECANNKIGVNKIKACIAMCNVYMTWKVHTVCACAVLIPLWGW